MQTPTFTDIGLANELKNWLICKWQFRCERVNLEWDSDRLLSFYNQTRRYLMNLQSVKRNQR